MNIQNGLSIKPTGRWVTTTTTGEKVKAFVPDALPLEVEYGALGTQLSRADQALGRPSLTVLRVHKYLEGVPVAFIAKTAKAVDLAVPTVARAFKHLMVLGIVEESTGRMRGQKFVYRRYVALLSEGAEPQP